MPLRREMAGDGRQKSQLIVNRGEMLQDTERRDDQREFRVEVEVAHVVGLDACPRTDGSRFSDKLRAAPLEHLLRAVDARDRAAGARHRQQDTAGAATDLEDRPSDGFGFCYVEIEVLALEIEWDAVVQQAEIRDVIVNRGHCLIFTVNTRPSRATSAFAARSDTSGDSIWTSPWAPVVTLTLESAPTTALSTCAVRSCTTGVLNVASNASPAQARSQRVCSSTPGSTCSRFWGSIPHRPRERPSTVTTSWTPGALRTLSTWVRRNARNRPTPESAAVRSFATPNVDSACRRSARSSLR